MYLKIHSVTFIHHTVYSIEPTYLPTYPPTLPPTKKPTNQPTNQPSLPTNRSIEQLTKLTVNQTSKC